MSRRTPSRHSVRSHTRGGAKVQSYMRGSGSKPRQRHRSPLTTTQRKALPASAFVFPKTRRYPIHDRARAINALARVSAVGSPSEKTKVRAEVHKRYPDLPTDWKERGGRKNYKPGEAISYKDSRGKRVSGTVRAVREEHYLVERKDKIYKVDRHSVFRQIGEALKKGGEAAGRLVVKGTRAGAAEIKRRLAERAEERRRWKDTLKQIEQEERSRHERLKLREKLSDERAKIRKRIEEGSLSKRLGKRLLKESGEAAIKGAKALLKEAKK